MCKLSSVTKNVKFLLEKNRVRTENIIVLLYFLISSVLVTGYPRGHNRNGKGIPKRLEALRTLDKKGNYEKS